MTSAAQVLAILEHAPALIVPMVREADPSILKRRPAPGVWSIHEHACHFAAVHPIMAQRLELMLAEEDPVIVSYDPERDEPAGALLRADLDAALRRFEQDRRELVARLQTLTPEQWQRTGRHEEYRSYSVFTMFRHLALHDLSHAYQIEDLLLRRDWPESATVAP